MAIIRQQTEIFNKPVRVVRAESGAAAPEALARVAANMSDIAFQEAAVYAEEVGKKAGLARATSDIVSIDPETGEPVAYNAPKGFGTIAQRAYRDIIDRRFEESVISEMKERASYIASNSSSAEQYKDRMADYITSMHGQAENQQGTDSYYVRFVRETGEKYLTSTYLALRKKEADAVRNKTIKDETISLFEFNTETTKLIASGADPSDIEARIAQGRQRVQNLYDIDAISASSYMKKMEDLNGLSSQNSNNQLLRIYSGLSTEDQALVTLALNDPTKAKEVAAQIGNPNLPTVIANARIVASVGSIQEAFSSLSSSMGDVREDKLDNALAESAPQISASSTFDEIDEIVSRADKDIKSDLGANLSAKLITTLLEESGNSVDGINTIVSELKKSNPDFDAVGSIVGGDRGAALASRLKQLDGNRIDGIAKAIEGRRTALSGLEASAEAAQVKALKDRALALEESENLLSDYDALVADTKASGSPQTDTMLTNFGNKFVDAALKRAEGIVIKSQDRFEAIASNIKNPDFVPQSPEERQMLELLRRSYAINDKTTEGVISSYRNRLESNNKRYNDSARLASVQTLIDEGRSVTKDDMKFYEDSILPEGISKDLTTLLQQQPVLQALQSGYVIPSVATAMEAALLGNNEVETVRAVQTFERLSKFKGITERGIEVTIDKMQDVLSDNAYAMYSAASYVARLEKNIEPVVILAGLKNYEGNLDEDLREDLGFTKSQPLSDAFASTPMSSNYKKEILAVMRVARSRGAQVNQDFVDSLIESYENDPERAKDESVYGVYFGDKTLFARTKHMTNDEIISHRESLLDKISQHPEFNKLMTGGTIADSFLSNFNYTTGIGALLESQLGTIEEQEQQSDRERLARGLQILGVDLKYSPITDSFKGENATPTWVVGFETKAKGFQPFMFNGEIELLQAKKKPGRVRSELLNQNINNLNVVVRSANATDKDKADAFLRVLASRPNMSVDNITKTQEFYLIEEAYGEAWVDVYNQFRSEYEALPE